MNYNDEIYNDIALEFGKSALSKYNPQPALSIKQAQYLLHKYGMDKGLVIAKRYGSLVNSVR